jgi:hypothetical protein
MESEKTLSFSTRQLFENPIAHKINMPLKIQQFNVVEKCRLCSLRDSDKVNGDLQNQVVFDNAGEAFHEVCLNKIIPFLNK